MASIYGRFGPATPDYDQLSVPSGRGSGSGTLTLRVPLAALPGYRLDLKVTEQPGPASLLDSESGFLALVGAPFWRGRKLTGPQAGLERYADRLARNPGTALAELDGQFALAWIPRTQPRVVLATDRFGSFPLFVTALPDARQTFFSTDYAWMADKLGAEAAINDQAIYDYLFFTTIPASQCLHRSISRLSPAQIGIIDDGRLETFQYWQPDFRKQPDPTMLAERLREALHSAVRRVASTPDSACFLSGGLDSSTVCGLAAQSGTTVHAYTMGFDEADFDETVYARLAAKHFDIDLHEHLITADEVLENIEEVTDSMREPFGNVSLMSTYICAKFAARNGARLLIAGDGGDELFAGNERYQKQLVFEMYKRLPTTVRHALTRPLSRYLSKLPLPGLAGKASSYLVQAEVPLPRRMYRYNLLERHAPTAALTEAFLEQVATGEPLEYLDGLYQKPETGDFLDRLLYLDWTVTLADNDLRKVRAATELAGVQVEFPMLANDVVAISTDIPSSLKLDRTNLRAFYKKSFENLLPPEIISKSKHGFGVPIGPWLRNHPDLRQLVYSKLDALKNRNILQPQFIEQIIESQRQDHAVYYGALLWPMFMLECWLEKHASHYGFA